MKINSLFFKSEKDVKGKSRIPLLYVGTLYFAEGLPYLLVSNISVVFFAKMGVPNSQLALFTSLLTWPWILKMFWAPVVDKYSTKRIWIIYIQFLCAVSFAIVAWSIQADAFFKLILILFSITAFLSATHDIAIDGFYMLALAGEQQALFIGIRSTFYRFAILFEGVLVFIAGFSEIQYGINMSWTIVFIFCSIIFLSLTGFHVWYLPFPVSDS
ncbi:MFS transporter, partial [candidate division KSB1 bacterium]|nr:MFS transporter [candidate division KSB1 bacterium]